MGATTFLVAKNRAYSTLATALNNSATSFDVAAGEGANFPSTYPFHLTIDDEIVSCTNRSTDTFTVVRAKQGTSAVAHASGKQVSLNITAKAISDLNTAVNFIEKYADYALSFWGKVTEVTDSTHFKVSGLAGLGASVFLPASGMPHEILVFKADGAAPQGEQTPVVAYTTGDGTFQHAAFTQLLVADDEIQILIPLLASLGTKATAAATGAVSNTKYTIAYIKQLVTDLRTVDGIVDDIKAVTAVIPDAGALTALLVSIASILTDTETTLPATLTTIDNEIEAIDTVVDSLQTDLDNATDGLGALKDLIDAIQTDVGDPTGETLASISAKIGNIARSIDVILGARWDSAGDLGTDIAQLLTYTDILDDGTNGLAAIKSLLNDIAGYITTEIADILTDTGTSIPDTIVTLQSAVDAIQTDLDNASDGLGALKTLIEANATLIGAKDATATADDLSNITTTDLSAKVRRLLLRFSSNAFAATVGGSSRTDLESMIQALADYVASGGGAYSVSLDGSARTNLDAFHTALGVLLGTRNTPVSAGILVDTESALALLRRVAQGTGLSILGDITGYTDINNLVVEDFIGWEDGYFIGWTAYLERDNAGAGAIPQGSRPVVTGYTSSTGALVLSDGLAAAGAIGDHLRLVHPILLDAYNTRGGVGGLADILENQVAELDTARGTSGAVSVDGGEDDVYNESSDNEFILLELRVDLNNMAEGDTITFKVYTTEDETERKISEDAANTFEGVQDPARVEIIGSANQVWGQQGIRVTAVKVSGATVSVTAFYRDSQRGS